MNYYNHTHTKQNKKIVNALQKFRDELNDHPDIEMRNYTKFKDISYKKKEIKLNKKKGHKKIEERAINLEKSLKKKKSDRTLKLDLKINQAKILRDKLVHLLYKEELAVRSQEYKLYRRDRIPEYYKNIDPRIYDKKIYPKKIQERLDKKLKLDKMKKENEKVPEGILHKLI